MARARDERLAWLAIRDQLERRSRRRSLLRRLVGNFVPTGRGLGSDVTGGSIKGRMMRYSFAVDDVAQRLSPEERQVLRGTGQLPEWFLEAVERRYRELRGRQGRDRGRGNRLFG
jgi:hypothetical protein